jgi:hypothetical protein
MRTAKLSSAAGKEMALERKGTELDITVTIEDVTCRCIPWKMPSSTFHEHIR